MSFIDYRLYKQFSLTDLTDCILNFTLHRDELFVMFVQETPQTYKGMGNG